MSVPSLYPRQTLPDAPTGGRTLAPSSGNWADSRVPGRRQPGPPRATVILEPSTPSPQRDRDRVHSPARRADGASTSAHSDGSSRNGGPITGDERVALELARRPRVDHLALQSPSISRSGVGRRLEAPRGGRAPCGAEARPIAASRLMTRGASGSSSPRIVAPQELRQLLRSHAQRRRELHAAGRGFPVDEPLDANADQIVLPQATRRPSPRSPAAGASSICTIAWSLTSSSSPSSATASAGASSRIRFAPALGESTSG